LFNRSNNLYTRDKKNLKDKHLNSLKPKFIVISRASQRLNEYKQNRHVHLPACRFAYTAVKDNSI
jgi:hypothetical protein